MHASEKRQNADRITTARLVSTKVPNFEWCVGGSRSVFLVSFCVVSRGPLDTHHSETHHSDTHHSDTQLPHSSPRGVHVALVLI